MVPRVPQMPGSLSTALRVVGTSLFAVAVLGGILAAYVTGYQFIHTEKHYLSFGLYGAILGLHLFIQSLFAFLEHRRMRGEGQPVRPGRSVALCIAAFQEDPDYLTKCLRSVKRIAFPDLKVVMVVDGNGPDDTYMLDIFRDVMGSEHSGSYVWRSNFHAWGEGETEAGLREGLARVQALVRSNTYSCILQKWGGKREVMYTAFRALGDSVDYIQVCDSDTVLDPACTAEMLRILEADPHVGGVGGDVQRAVLDGLQRGARVPVVLRVRAVHQRPPGHVPQRAAAAVPRGLVPPDLPGQQVQLRGRPAPHQPRAQPGLPDQVHGSLQVPDGDAHAVPALAQPADPLEQVLLPRVALQRALVPQASPLDDLRVGGHRLLPLLPHRHRHPALLPRPRLEHPPVPADGAAGGCHQGHLRLLPARQCRDDLHVPLRPPLHVQPAARQNLRHCHHQQVGLGHLRAPHHCGELRGAAAGVGVGGGAAGRAGLHRLQPGPLQRDRGGLPRLRCHPLCLLLGGPAHPLPGHRRPPLRQEAGAVWAGLH
ncbi:hyaluronan synthase 3 isoform X2 [Onychostruthus taczanowskii]|uniref:hyaluronan synthase 3 isoform X2 n=1 Tax=Onychostruthus taczanowskii TaxID=356909 RepID=UPI001B7FFDAD|nr:hyaluronan synthase 3 isoform X2 [Onychostruthus taczanowskii]